MWNVFDTREEAEASLVKIISETSWQKNAGPEKTTVLIGLDKFGILTNAAFTSYPIGFVPAKYFDHEAFEMIENYRSGKLDKPKRAV